MSNPDFVIRDNERILAHREHTPIAKVVECKSVYYMNLNHVKMFTDFHPSIKIITSANTERFRFKQRIRKFWLFNT